MNRVLYHPYTAMDTGPFKYIERGYIRGLEKAGCTVAVWDGADAAALRKILSDFRPQAFIGFLRGGSPMDYGCADWTRPPSCDLLLAYRRRAGLKVAVHTHPDPAALTRHLSLDIERDDRSGAYRFYTQAAPPLPEESLLAGERFIDIILHSFSSGVGASCFDYWHSRSVPVHCEPLAADDEVYYPPSSPVPERHKITFIGGWWPFKGQQLDRYLKPILDRYRSDVAVFGRNWPYASRGELADEQFNPTVWGTSVNLTFHEPSQVQGVPVHVNERIFKLLACGAFVLSDNNLCLQEYFEPDEIVLCPTPEEMLDKIRHFLDHPEGRRRLAEKGHQAVMRRHTYKIRAETLLRSLQSV